MADKRFRALRLIANLLEIVAWVVLALGTITGVTMIAMATVDMGPLRPYLGELTALAPATGMGGAAGGGAVIALTLLYFLVLLASGQWLRVGLSIEENTRYTGAMVRHMWNVLGPPHRPGENEPPELIV